MPSDDPVMPRAASVSGSTTAGEAPQPGEDVAITLEQAEQLLAELETLSIIRCPWLGPLIDEFKWAVDVARAGGTICECGFQIIPPEKT